MPAKTLEDRLHTEIEGIYISGWMLHKEGQTPEEQIDSRLAHLAHCVKDAQELRAKIAKRNARKAATA